MGRSRDSRIPSPIPSSILSPIIGIPLRSWAKPVVEARLPKRIRLRNNSFKMLGKHIRNCLLNLRLGNRIEDNSRKGAKDAKLGETRKIFFFALRLGAINFVEVVPLIFYRKKSALLYGSPAVLRCQLDWNHCICHSIAR